MAQRKTTRSGGAGRAGVHVALLRGINVGGKNKLPMKDLAEVFTDAGCRDVRTYIQSGNVVLSAAPSLARRLPSLIAGEIADRFGLRVPVVVRTGSELEQIVDANPFARRRFDPKMLHVGFLAQRPTAAAIAKIDPERSPQDEFSVIGSEIYILYAAGVAGTKLNNVYLDRTLATTSTMRNWNTVLKLRDLATG